MVKSGKQPPEVQEKIRELLEAGFDPTTIHRRLHVGRSSVYRMKKCLAEHGSNYSPPDMHKKNGRPKSLSPSQELAIRDWLRDPKNRKRYLDDLVWLIHDRFGIVCSTTTMSKLKRKWAAVVDFEERGQPIDDTTRAQLMETHPHLDVLQQSPQLQNPARNHQLQIQQDELHTMVPQLEERVLPYPDMPDAMPHQHLPSQLDESFASLHDQLKLAAQAAVAVDQARDNS